MALDHNVSSRSPTEAYVLDTGRFVQRHHKWHLRWIWRLASWQEDQMKTPAVSYFVILLWISDICAMQAPLRCSCHSLRVTKGTKGNIFKEAWRGAAPEWPLPKQARVDRDHQDKPCSSPSGGKQHTKKLWFYLLQAGKSKNERASIYEIMKLRPLKREVTTISPVAQSNLYQGASLLAGMCWLPACALWGSGLWSHAWVFSSPPAFIYALVFGLWGICQVKPNSIT